jgi:hypothetical protein
MKIIFVALISAIAFAQFPVSAADKMHHKHGASAPSHEMHSDAHKGHGMTGHKMPMQANTGGIPHDLDTGKQRFTDHGMFSVDIASRLDPMKINKMHSWTLRVRNKDGKPIEGAKIAIAGGMPQHGHDLPTKPRVTKSLGDGKYLVEGIRFSMNGWWEVKFDIDSGHHKDSVTFNLVLK